MRSPASTTHFQACAPPPAARYERPGFRIRVNRAQAIAVQRRLKAKGLPAVLRKVFAERGGDPVELVRLVLAASPSTLSSRIPDLYLDPKLAAADRSAARTMRSFADHVAPHA